MPNFGTLIMIQFLAQINDVLVSEMLLEYSQSGCRYMTYDFDNFDDHWGQTKESSRQST
jgi:hypothetical protein